MKKIKDRPADGNLPDVSCKNDIMEELQEEEALSAAKRTILLAASASFAEHGFRHGTTRDIAKRAKVNIGAINYHFGTKEQLYFFVLNYWKKKVFKKYSLESVKDSELSAEERLRLFIRLIIYMLMDEGGVPWLGKLLTREVVLEPTSAFESIMRDEIKFIFDLLIGIVSELLGELAINKKYVKLCAMSILGQCTFFYHSRPISALVYAEDNDIDFNDVEQLVEHVYQFSITAIHTCRPL